MPRSLAPHSVSNCLRAGFLARGVRLLQGDAIIGHPAGALSLILEPKLDDPSKLWVCETTGKRTLSPAVANGESDRVILSHEELSLLLVRRYRSDAHTAQRLVSQRNRTQ